MRCTLTSTFALLQVSMHKCIKVGRTCPDRDTFVRDRDLEFDIKIHERFSAE